MITCIGRCSGRVFRIAAMFLGAMAVTFAGAPATAATRIDLDGEWSFRIDPDGAGERAGWQATPPAETETVRVPHTWNRGRHETYLGIAWYFRDFDLPPLPADASVVLHFGATFYSARVWVNGTEAGRHEGGYTAYSFDVTALLREHNHIAVAIDNRPGMATIPGFGARGAADAWYDWWTYGGIVRSVSLSVHGPVRIAGQAVRYRLDGAAARVTDTVRLHSRWPHLRRAKLRATVAGPDGRSAAGAERVVELPPGQSEVPVEFRIDDIRRWDLGHANLYRVSIAVEDEAGHALDRDTASFGLRDIRIRDRRLYLNGERVRLSGITRHSDSPWEGLPETAGTIRHDFEDLEALNVAVTRPSHYPTDPAVLDFADRHGILLIPEIPIWQFSEAQLADPGVLALAKQQMRELIEQAGNHPSVFAWSVGNESATGTPAGIAFFREMKAYIRELDPDRFVTYADDNLPKLERPESSAAMEADFLMMNQYFGAWHGPREALGPALDKVDRLFPDKMVFISEFGFPGIFAKDPAQADAMRVSIIEEQLPLLAARDWIAGAILWCYQDYRSRRYLWPGHEEAYFEHGVVDRNRQRKPSYFAWQALTAPAGIESRWVRTAAGAPERFDIVVTPNGADRIPSYPLDGHRVRWQLLDDGNRELARGERALGSAGEPLAISEAVPAAARERLSRLRVQLLRPDGSTAMETALPAAAPGEAPADAG